MKTCPSCSAKCENRFDVCPTCGHAFEEAGAPKRTMMGFPSLAAALEEAEAQEPEEPAKQTLFGFPAQKAGLAQPSESVADDEELDAATSIIPASAFAFDSGQFTAAPDRDEDDDEDIPPTMEKDLRGTVAGMHVNTTDPYDTDDATEIVSGTAVFPGIRVAADDEPDEDDLRSKGTLMGMSLADAQLQAPMPKKDRSTQFAIPAVQAEKMQQATSGQTSRNDESDNGGGTQRMASVRDTSEEPQVDDLPTQAWSPGALANDDDDGRKKLLEKIRKSRPTADAAAREKKRPSHEGPDLSALKNLKPKRDTAPSEDERDTNEQPSAPRKDHSAGVQVESDPFSDGEESLEALSDPEFGLAETDIASGDLLNQAVQQYQSPKPDEPAEPAKPSTPTPAPAPEPSQPRPPVRTQRAGVYETFDGGSSSDVSAQPSQPQPAQPPRQSQPQPAPPQPMTQPSAPISAPHNIARPEPSGEMHRPYQPPPTGQQPRPPGPNPQYNQGPAPYSAPQQPEPTDDPFIRIIQAAFGVAAGVIAVLVQVFVFMSLDSPPNKSIVMMALAVVLGLVAIAAAALPLKSSHRTMAFFGLAILLFMVGIVGKLVVGLPGTFLVVLFSALLAFVTGAFPYLSRLVS